MRSASTSWDAGFSAGARAEPRKKSMFDDSLTIDRNGRKSGPMPKKTVLFYRDYIRFSGGQLKVRDYFDHVQSSPNFRAEIYVTPNSSTDHIWRDAAGLVAEYRPELADVLFLAGVDWRAIPPGMEEETPVLNLIQHIRHAVPGDPRHRFLTRRAVRICVSQEVADAIRASGQVNGPIHVIPNGVAMGDLAFDPPEKSVDVFIAGLKAPHLAKDLTQRLTLRRVTVDCLTGRVDRTEFLHRMGRAKIVVALPHKSEGFFLPPLEAMLLNAAVVCPDAIGNRSFCIHRETCVMPAAALDELELAVMYLLEQPFLRNSLVARAFTMAKGYSLERERDSFLQLLDDVERLCGKTTSS